MEASSMPISARLSLKLLPSYSISPPETKVNWASRVSFHASWSTPSRWPFNGSSSTAEATKSSITPMIISSPPSRSYRGPSITHSMFGSSCWACRGAAVPISSNNAKSAAVAITIRVILKISLSRFGSRCFGTDFISRLVSSSASTGLYRKIGKSVKKSNDSPRAGRTMPGR